MMPKKDPNFKREEDMHFRNAAKAWGISIEDVTEQQRLFAKVCAFGASDEDAALRNLQIALNWNQAVRRSGK